jgi:hypothetical protein
VRISHAPAKIHATFADPHLVSRAGLVPVMALAQRAGLPDLAAGHVRIGRECGVNADLKVSCVVAGTVAGRTASMTWTCCGTGRWASCPAGSGRRPRWIVLRSFTPDNVFQPEKASGLLLAGLARQAPLLPGADVVAFLDIDSMQKCACGHARQGAAFGHTKIQGTSVLVRGLNAR